jgi:hypothetical protein
MGPCLLNDALMQHFGSWLFLDLCSRTGQRGRRQKEPMRGVWSSRTYGRSRGARQPSRMRGSDFSLRLTLWIHGWHRLGLPIQEAAGKAAEEDFVKSHLGRSKRGRPSAWGEGVTEVDDTARTFYYKFLARRPGLDINMLFDGMLANYLGWREWVIRADEFTLNFAAGLYTKRGLPEQGKQFLALADRIRQTRVLPLLRPSPS